MTLKVTTFSSKGRVSRVYSDKCEDKVVHLQSDNQMRVFIMLEWEDYVKNIDVNVKLQKIEETLTNIDNLNLSKFRNRETGELFELHTNFLVTLKSHPIGESQIAISTKSVSELERKIVIEKLEIERRYWQTKGIRFVIITDKEINRQVTDNIIWVRDTRNYNLIKNKEKLSEKLYYFMREQNDYVISNALNNFDKEEGIKEGTALFLFRYLIADKQIEVDMKKSINLSGKINKIVSF